VQAFRRAIEALDADNVASAADVAEGGWVGSFVPERNRALLYYPEEGLMCGSLPANVLVDFMELHTPRATRAMRSASSMYWNGGCCPEEVSDSVGDGGRLHESGVPRVLIARLRMGSSKELQGSDEYEF
jgi:hypothetical protein